MPFEQIVGLHVTDAAEYEAYRRGMRPILAAFGGDFRYDFVVAETLAAPEDSPPGRAINRVFAIRFPDRAARERFFSDPAYLEVRRRHFDRSVAARALISETGG
jgi:uncharacterized protein (DUF1330 family)